MKTISIALLIVCAFATAHAQFGIEWENTIGGTHLDQLRSIEQTSDGGYIIGASSMSEISMDKTENSVGGSDFWIIKLDSAGSIEWQNTIGGSSTDGAAIKVHQTADGGYIVGGMSSSSISGDKTENSRGETDLWILKLNSAGNILWQKTIGGSEFEFFGEIRETADGGYIVGASSNSPISGDKIEDTLSGSFFVTWKTDYWIIKLNSTGDIAWQEVLGGAGVDRVSDIQQTPDAGYIIGGFSDSQMSFDKTENSQGSYDYWLVKIDSTGNIQWQNTIGGSSSDRMTSLVQTPDGGFLLGGTSMSAISGDKTKPGKGMWDYWIVKVDPTGNIQWQNTMGGSKFDELTDLEATADGGFILAGYSDSPISGDKTETSHPYTSSGYAFWVVKIDASGNIQWQNTMGGGAGAKAYAIRQTTDGGYIAGGYASAQNGVCDKSETGAGGDCWIVKMKPVQGTEDVMLSPGMVYGGRLVEIQFTPHDFTFDQQNEYIVLENNGNIVDPYDFAVVNDTTAIGTYAVPLYPCNSYNVVTACGSFAEKLEVQCQPVSATVTPNSVERCSQLPVYFTSHNFHFIRGSAVYFEKDSVVIYPDSLAFLSDTTVVGYFSFNADDSCGSYALRHYWTDSFPNKFEILCTPPQCAAISGIVYGDLNENCVKDTGDIPARNALIELSNGPYRYYATTDSTGFYSATGGIGQYSLRTPNANLLWEAPSCSGQAQSVTINTLADSITVDFPVVINSHCPFMEVTVGAPLLRACRGATYTIQYCNKGFYPASNAYIEVVIDPLLSVDSSSVPWRLPQSGNLYTFDIGDLGELNVQDCGWLKIYTTVACAITIGQTICVDAHIYPDSICIDPDTAWDRSSIVVEGRCVNNDTVQFRIANVGTGNMRDSLNYIITEDNVMLRSKKFLLQSGQQLQTFEMANGSTFRLTAQQSPGHPGKKHPSVAVQGCGTNSVGSVSLGFVNIMPEDDADNFIDINCTEVRGSYDPNDKTSTPKGIGEDKVISSSTELEYKIRFQNTGNDTAFKVVIRDTLSEFLDITTVQLGASSHPYDFRIYGEGILEWTFDNILLPDSFVNEPESHGFVEFRIAQAAGNVDGTVIENSADIYFDFNVPVKTNVEFNTVGDIQQALLTVIEEFDRENNIVVYPNPFNNQLTVEISEAAFTKAEFVLYDLQGRELKRYTIPPSGTVNITGLRLQQGMYFYRVITEGNTTAAGKIIRH